MKKGIVYVKKAGMWLYYETYNVEHRSDYEEFFDTKEQAEEKLANLIKSYEK